MTRQITPIQLPSGSVMPGEIALPDGQVLVGNSGGVAAARTMSGDVTLSDTGVATLVSTAAALQPFSGRNKIINGDMRIDQRNAGSYVTVDGAFGPDRFSIGLGTMSGQAPQMQQSTNAPTAVAGYTNSLHVNISGTGAAPAVGGYAIVAQTIEGNNISDLGWGTAVAKPIMISFWAYSSVAGTYGLALRNSAVARCYVASYALLAATWTYVTLAIPGDTSGVWATDNTGGILLNFDMGVGTSFSTAGNVWTAGNKFGLTGGTKLCATSGADFYVTGLQLESGSIATPFERVDYTTMFNRCQRYYQEIFPGQNGIILSTGLAVGTASTFGAVTYPQKMRATPSIGLPVDGAGAAQASWGTAVDGVPGTIGTTSVVRSNSQSASLLSTGYTAAFVVGNVSIFESNSTTTKITLSAEL